MRKGTALVLAGIVAASLVAGIALFGGSVEGATAASKSEPQVIRKHRTITVYRTVSASPAVVVVPASSTSDAETEADETEEGSEVEATEPSEVSDDAVSDVSDGGDDGEVSDGGDGLVGDDATHDDDHASAPPTPDPIVPTPAHGDA